MRFTDTSPMLRFPEFVKTIKPVRLSQILNKMQSGISRELNDDDIGYPILRSSNINDSKILFENIKYWYKTDTQGADLKNYILNDGDLLVNFINSQAQIGKSALFENLLDRPVIYTTNLMRLSFTENIVPNFINYIFQCESYRKFISTITKPAVNQASFTTKDFGKFDVLLPEIEEQQKIADFLSSVDKKIALLKEKHDLLVQYKKGVMQKLFSQEIRFKDEAGNNFPDWIEDRLDSFIVKASDPVKVDPDETYREIGVRSHAKGVFHKKPIKGHELGNKRVFWVHPKAFIVNIVFAWEHAVALTSDSETGFIASHRFPMFVPKEDRVDLRYFTIFFKSKRGKHLLGLASPGGAGRNKTLGQSNFAELKLTIPCLEEQIRIADFYDSLNQKEKLVAQQIEHTQTFKKGLLQQMFV